MLSKVYSFEIIWESKSLKSKNTIISNDFMFKMIIKCAKFKSNIEQRTTIVTADLQKI